MPFFLSSSFSESQTGVVLVAPPLLKLDIKIFRFFAADRANVNFRLAKFSGRFRHRAHVKYLFFLDHLSA